MTEPHFFTDEDVYAAVAPALRRAGIDTVSTPETGRRQQSDESQLDWASADGRVIVTFNVAHFAKLHADWLAQGRHHSGIVVSSQRPISDIVRRLLRLARAKDAEWMRGRLEFLSDW
ncbi:MAG: DUF5615 family PIN-like protein [Thermoguttaceae bacterium]|jgi:hypothetical protein